MAENANKQVYIRCGRCYRGTWIDWRLWVHCDLAWKYEGFLMICGCGGVMRLTKQWRESSTSVN